MSGFEDHGVKIYEFNTSEYFNRNHFDKLQFKFKCGPTINKMRKDLISRSAQIQPDFIFFQRPVHFPYKTINSIKTSSNNTKIIVFHNDNPYIHNNKFLRYRHFFSILPLADIVYVYRHSNINHAKKYTNAKIELFLPYFYKGIHDSKFVDDKKNDVIFIGHYENDGRDKAIKYLLDKGIKIYIAGTGWENSIIPPCLINSPHYGRDYVNQIKNSKIAIAFYSKYNQDVYTRRCFEIPAIGTLLMTQDSHELKKIFEPDADCVYFATEKELLQKIKFYLANEYKRKQIALSGQEKTIHFHSNINRAEQILNDIASLKT